MNYLHWAAHTRRHPRQAVMKQFVPLQCVAGGVVKYQPDVDASRAVALNTQGETFLDQVVERRIQRMNLDHECLVA